MSGVSWAPIYWSIFILPQPTFLVLAVHPGVWLAVQAIHKPCLCSYLYPNWFLIWKLPTFFFEGPICSLLGLGWGLPKGVYSTPWHHWLDYCLGRTQPLNSVWALTLSSSYYSPIGTFNVPEFLATQSLHELYEGMTHLFPRVEDWWQLARFWCSFLFFSSQFMNSGDAYIGKGSAFTLISPISMCSETITITNYILWEGKLFDQASQIAWFLQVPFKNLERNICFLWDLDIDTSY